MAEMTTAEKLSKIYEGVEHVEGLNTELEQTLYGTDTGGKSWYDEFWDTYQNNGEPTDYARAFSGNWRSLDIFKPKHNIIVTNAYMMFAGFPLEIDLADYFQQLGIVFDTSRAANTQYMIQASNVTRVGVIDFSGSTNSKPIDNVFAQCKKLVTIDKIIVKEGSQGAFGSTFTNCVALENIIIEGEIKSNGLDLQWSTKLSKASITSIINALSTSTTGLTVTLSKKAVDAAFIEKNLFTVMPNTDTSGSNTTNTIYKTTTTSGTVCGMAQIEAGKRYVLKRNISGKGWRYFWYDTEPLDTGAKSIGGAYLGATTSNETVTAPANAKYIVIRAAEGLTDEEMKNFELVLGEIGTTSKEWAELEETRTNWNISLV